MPILTTSTVHFEQIHAIILVDMVLVDWQDGFEPRYSIKGHFGSFLKSADNYPTVSAMHSHSNKYVIACEPKGSSHEDVEKMFATELASFAGSSGVPAKTFDSWEGRPVMVHTEVLA